MALNRTLLFSIRSFHTRRIMPLLMTSSHQYNTNYTNTRTYKARFEWRGNSVYLASGVILTGYLLYKQCYCTNVLCYEGENSIGERDDKIQHKTDAFKKRYTMNYENRIRMYSLPDKIFRYSYYK